MPNPRFGDEELAQIQDLFRGERLWPYGGGGAWNTFMGAAVDGLRRHFATTEGEEGPFVVPTCSGTASIHVALGGLGIPAGSEVIVSPITDMGSITPILFHNAIPVFADVDLDTGLITAETIAAQINERTSAVIAVHLSGSASDMGPMVELCQQRGIALIEDTSQGLGATLEGKPLGTFGTVGCFSLNSWKHITTGEGGFVLVNDPELRHSLHNFSDKHRNRFGSTNPAHAVYAGVGHSMRMSELQGAMLVAQLPKLGEIARRRRAVGRMLDERLGAVAGIVPQKHPATAEPSYFQQMFRVDREVRDKERIIRNINRALRGRTNLSITGAYTQNDAPIYKYPLFQTRAFFKGPAGDVWPGEILAQQLYGDPHYTRRYDEDNLDLPNAQQYTRDSFIVLVETQSEPDDAELCADVIVAELRNAGLVD